MRRRDLFLLTLGVWRHTMLGMLHASSMCELLHVGYYIITFEV